MDRQRNQLLIAVVAAVALTGLACDDSSPTGPEPGELAFRTLLLSQYSGIDEARDEVIVSADRFRQVWSGIADAGPQPPIDFRSEAVALATFGGGDGCAKIEVREVTAERAAIVVGVVKSVPGADCACTQQYTTAVHVVAFPRTPGVATRTERRQEVFGCG